LPAEHRKNVARAAAVEVSWLNDRRHTAWRGPTTQVRSTTQARERTALARLIYIGGYGRSGSTLLEYLLASHPSVVACGEVERHLRSFGRKTRCTCGLQITKCPIWSAFQHTKRNRRAWDHERLSLALLEHVKGQYTVMVDSSKTAWGAARIPFQLWRHLGEDFLLAHIVRDPRGVCWSRMRTPWKPEKSSREFGPTASCLRTAVGWVAANLACEAFGWLHPRNYLRVRYEDLIHAPRKTIATVLERVSLTAPPDFSAGEATDNRHQLYGNAMRFRSLSLSDLREDVAWKTAMPAMYRPLITGLCWPLYWRYGYGWQKAS
jgi:hypothetical protein